MLGESLFREEIKKTTPPPSRKGGGEQYKPTTTPPVTPTKPTFVSRQLRPVKTAPIFTRHYKPTTTTLAPTRAPVTNRKTLATWSRRGHSVTQHTWDDNRVAWPQTDHHSTNNFAQDSHIAKSNNILFKQTKDKYIKETFACKGFHIKGSSLYYFVK